MSDYILSILLFLPLAGCIFIFLLPGKLSRYFFWIAFSASLLQVGALIWVIILFDSDIVVPQLVEKFPWISFFNINYYIGLDGISLPFLIMAVLVGLVSLVFSRKVAGEIKGYYALLLFLIFTLTGIFLSLDLFMFLTLYILLFIPGYFIMNLQSGNGSPGRYYSLASIVGGFILLPVILGLYQITIPHSYSITDIIRFGDYGRVFQIAAFFLVFVGFGLPMTFFPFHFLSGNFFKKAPLSLLILQSGIIIKVGFYGIIRIGVYALPEGYIFWSVPISWLGILSLLYLCFLMLNEEGLKNRLIYLLFASQGLPFLGLASLRAASGMVGNPEAAQMGISGTMLLIWSCSSVFPALFILSHLLSEERNLAGFNRMPFLKIIFAFLILAAMGIPGSSMFVGNFLILNAAFQLPSLQILSFFALTGWGFLALLLFSILHKWYQNKPADSPERHFPSLEYSLPVLFFLFLLLLFGIAPDLFMTIIGRTVKHLIETAVYSAGIAMNL